MRAVELAFGHADPFPGEPVPSEEGVRKGLADAVGETPALAPLLQAGLAAVQGMTQTLDARLPSTQGVDFTPLRKLLQCVAEAGQRAQGVAVPGAQVPAVLATRAPALVDAGNGAIACREDVVRALERACEWIERNEPSNPAPLLIRRSQRLMSKNFIDIVRELMPEGVAQIEKLAGTPPH